MDKSTIATIKGTMLVPGVSKNSRLYTPTVIGKAVKRMRERLSDPDGLPIVMRTHHDAGDDSRLIVGRITDVSQLPDGRATYEARLFNTTAGRDIAAIIGDRKAPALRSTSIHGYWIGPVEHINRGGERVEAGEDLEVDAIDFTGSPGVPDAKISSVAFESVAVPGRVAGAITEAGEAEVTVTEVADGGIGWIGERYSAAQLRQMAAKGQAMTDADGNISYPIANKTDLRRAIRAVGRGGADHDAIRKHIITRAAALGLSSMIPPTWNKDGSMQESTPAQGVAEAYVTVCVGGDQGNIVQVCVDNADGDSLKKAAKKAAKLAANFLGDDDSGDGNFNITVNPDLDGDGDGMSAESVTVTVGGRRLSEAETRAWLTRRSHTHTSGPAPEPARTAPAAEATTTETESAVSETVTPAAETATSALNDDFLAKLGAVVGAAVKEAVADIKAPKVKDGKKSGKKATSESTKSTPAEGKQKAGADTAVKEAAKESVITPEKLETLLAEREKQTINKVRETLIAEGALPTRKGHRFVNETDDSDKLTGDDLWNKRKEIFAQAVPSLFVGTEVLQPAEPAATAA